MLTTFIDFHRFHDTNTTLNVPIINVVYLLHSSVNSLVRPLIPRGFASIDSHSGMNKRRID